MGGFKMPDIFVINQTCKLKWLKKLLFAENKEKWQSLARYLFNLKVNTIFKKLPDTCREKCLSPFYRQVFHSWQNLRKTTTNS